MNYENTFIRIASDSSAQSGLVPPTRGDRKPIHLLQYELISAKPYEYTQEDVLWLVHTIRNSISLSRATADARTEFLARGQPCLRTSALCKRYGWGFHFDDHGRVALVSAGTPEYNRLAKDKKLKQLVAMRNARA